MAKKRPKADEKELQFSHKPSSQTITGPVSAATIEISEDAWAFWDLEAHAAVVPNRVQRFEQVNL